MDAIKVTQVIDSTNLGGAETVLLGLLDGIDRNLFQVSLCVIGAGPLTEAARDRGFPVCELPPFAGKKDLRFLCRLLEGIRTFSPDLLQGHLYPTAFYTALAGTMLGIPSIATLHCFDQIESRWEKLSVRALHRLSAAVVVVTRHQHGHFGFPAASPKVKVIRNGIRLRDAAPLHQKPAADEAGAPPPLTRESLGLGDGPLLLNVANMRPVKGHRVLLQAMLLVAQAAPRARLLLVGDGIVREELELFCRSNGLDGHVSFLGHRSDVPQLLSLADLFVSASLSETTSVAIMEAMCAGAAVVASDLPGNRELIEPGRSGVLVPAGDPEALAREIVSLLEDGARAAELRRQARRRALEEFGQQRMVTSYQELYLALLQCRRHVAVAGGANP